MRILILHNRYKQQGGEDTVVAVESKLLSSAGHDVRVHVVDNDTISDFAAKMRAAFGVVGNASSATLVKKLCAEFLPDVVHIHNFFPLLSPSVHIAAGSTGAAVVQTLHNYRLLCANGFLLQNGKICEKCLHGSALNAIGYRCYRDSYIGSAAVVAMQLRSAKSNDWLASVDRFIALTQFAKAKFVAAGFPADRIYLKPNFTFPVPMDARPAERVKRAIFVGRLSEEKGVRTLLEAWRNLPDIELVIVGDGPLRPEVEESGISNIKFLGPLPRERVLHLMRQSLCLIFPSVWYETFGLTIVESLSVGTPVIGSRLGAMVEIFSDGKGGRMFEPGDAAGLVTVLRNFLSEEHSKISEEAYAKYINNYTAEVNISLIEKCYKDAVAQKKKSLECRL